MTDRVQNLVIVLDGDYRTDDVQGIVDAIRMIRGVADVQLGEPVTSTDHFARERAAMDLRGRISDVLSRPHG